MILRLASPFSRHSSRGAVCTAMLARRLALLCAIVVALDGLCAPVGLAAEPSPAEPSARDAWVERGRDAFGKELKSAPWYDSKSDSLRPLAGEPAKGKASPDSTGNKGRDVPLELRNSTWLALLIKVCAFIVLTALLLGLAWLLIRAYLERERSAVTISKAADKLSTADRVEALPIDIESDMDDLPGAARRLYAEGKYSEAIVYLFSYELFELDRHQHIRLAKGKTNRQYLRELAGKADLRSLLSITTDLFERAFFGGERLDRASFEACWSELQNFATLVAREPA